MHNSLDRCSSNIYIAFPCAHRLDTVHDKNIINKMCEIAKKIRSVGGPIDFSCPVCNKKVNLIKESCQAITGLMVLAPCFSDGKSVTKEQYLCYQLVGIGKNRIISYPDSEEGHLLFPSEIFPPLVFSYAQTNCMDFIKGLT